MLSKMVMRSVPVAVIMPIPTPKSFGSSWLITRGLKDAPLRASVKPVMPIRMKGNATGEPAPTNIMPRKATAASRPAAARPIAEFFA